MLTIENEKDGSPFVFSFEEHVQLFESFWLQRSKEMSNFYNLDKHSQLDNW